MALLTQGCVFIIQRNAEFLAKHGFDAFEIFFHENKLFLNVSNRLRNVSRVLVNSSRLFVKRCSILSKRLSTAARILISCATKRNRTPVKMQTTTRHIGDVAVLDISGRITLGEGNVMLRELVRELADKGNKKIVLNLGEVQYIDSSGVGELVKTHTTVRNQGGQLRLVNLNKRVHDLLQMTRLSAVFDIHKDEASAIESFGSHASSQAVA